MRQVAIIVEGQTEDRFVEDILAQHLLTRNVFATGIIVKTSRTPGRPAAKGGGTWSHWRRDITSALRSTNFALVTMMIDFYGYPDDGPGHCHPLTGPAARTTENWPSQPTSTTGRDFCHT